MEAAPQDPILKPFPFFVMSFYEENTIYIFRENGQEIRVRLGIFHPQDWEVLTPEEKKYLKNYTTF